MIKRKGEKAERWKGSRKGQNKTVIIENEKNKNEIEMWANPKLNKILKILFRYISIVVVLVCSDMSAAAENGFTQFWIHFFLSFVDFSLLFLFSPSIFLFYCILPTVSPVRKTHNIIIIYQYSSIQ